MKKIWPTKLNSPHIELGIPIDIGLQIIHSCGEPVISEDNDSKIYTVSTKQFSVAIHEKNGVVSSSWYDDTSGRIWSGGRARKIDLYLARLDNLKNWELRLNDGYIQFYFNDVMGLTMAYGIHKDVIRFNKKGL